MNVFAVKQHAVIIREEREGNTTLYNVADLLTKHVIERRTSTDRTVTKSQF